MTNFRVNELNVLMWTCLVDKKEVHAKLIYMLIYVLNSLTNSMITTPKHISNAHQNQIKERKEHL